MSQEVTRYSVVAIQTANPSAFDKTQLMKNLQRNIELIDVAMMGYGFYGFPIKLMAFPEFTILGLPYFTTHEYIENGLVTTVPGEVTEKYVEAAKKYNVYISTGSFTEYDPEYPKHVFNTVCLVGPEGILVKYRKIQTFEAIEFLLSSPHNIEGYDFNKNPAFPVVKTSIGNLCVAICYDFIFPEPFREFTMHGAEVIIRASAYSPPFASELPTNWWTIISQVRSLENVCYGVHVNQGSALRDMPPYSWPGGSCIVDYEGRVLSQVLASGEQLVFGHINLDALRDWRANSYQHIMPAQLRSEAYTYLQTPRQPQGIFRKDEEPTLEKVQRAMDESRKKLWPDAVARYRTKPWV